MGKVINVASGDRGLVSATDGCDLGIKLRDRGTLASAICSDGSEVSGRFLVKGQNHDFLERKGQA